MSALVHSNPLLGAAWHTSEMIPSYHGKEDLSFAILDKVMSTIQVYTFVCFRIPCYADIR